MNKLALKEDFITFENVSKYYSTDTGVIHALDDLNGSIKERELVCLLGPSGCGKSTLLWSMGGLEDISSGSIKIDGKEVNGPRGDIGIVFQESNLLPWRTIMDNVLLPFQIKKIDHTQSPYKETLEYLFKITKLEGYENKFPRELSGGMQQRASLIRALAYDPSVLLLDEPFAALDVLTRETMNELIMKLWEDTKKTIAFVTHNIVEAVYVADRIFVMTPSPGRLSKIFEINLPRPRPTKIMTDPKFLSYVDEIKESIVRQEEQIL